MEPIELARKDDPIQEKKKKYGYRIHELTKTRKRDSNTDKKRFWDLGNLERK
tara:strand:- start:94 stop:249 length:156 start_codon:yes stop_codon:yes gene_type:complete